MATSYQQPYTQMQENSPSSYLQNLMQSIASGRQQLQGQKEEVQGISDENEVLRLLQAEGAKAQGELAQQQQAIDAGQALEAEKRKRAAATVFGVDLLDPANRIAYLVNERNAAVDEAITESKRASQLARANLFDSPFDYMVNRPFLAENIAQGKAAEERAKFIDAEIANTNAQAKSTIETQAAIQETFTTEEARIQNSVLALKAAEAVRTLNLTQNKERTADLQTLRQLTEADLKLADVAHNARYTQDKFLMEREALHAASAERAAQKKVDRIQWAAYNKAAKAFNRPPIATLEEFTATYNAYKGSEMGKIMTRMIDHGSTIIGYRTDGEATPGFEQYVGRSPGDAIVNLQYVGGRLDPAAQRTSEFLLAEGGEAIREARAANPNLKLTEESTISLINARIVGAPKTDKDGKVIGKTEGVVSSMQKNVEQDLQAGRVKNIYRAPDVNTMGQTYPNLTQTPVWTQVIAPAAAAEPSPSGNTLLKVAALKIAEGKLTPEQAADGLKAYFSGAVELNNRTALYNQVGLPKQEGYPVAVDNPLKPLPVVSFLKRDELGQVMFAPSAVSVDMTNAAQLKNYLMRYIPRGQ